VIGFVEPLQGGWWSESLSPKAERAKKVLEGFEAVVEKALSEFEVPGVAVGVVVDGHIVLAKGYGYAELEQKALVNADTLFPIGSCTKAFTSFALGCLVDEGLLDWDLPVIDVLPEFRMRDSYATWNLTIRDLLAHRTGVPRHDFMWYNSKFTREEIVSRLRYLDSACAIRERYYYNNMMYLVAGVAAEKITHQSWEDLIRAKIVKPLGMKRTNFSIADLQKLPNFAYPYLQKGAELKKMPFRDVSVIGPAGSMNSTVNDLCKWVQLHLTGGVWEQKPLISSCCLKETYSPQIVAPGHSDNEEILLHDYALGWHVQTCRGFHNLMHEGGVDGFTSIISLLPREGMGVIVLSNKNLSVLPRLLAGEVLDRLLELPSNQNLSKGLIEISLQKGEKFEELKFDYSQRKLGTSPSHALEEYGGSYVHPAYGRLDLKLIDGQLVACLHGISYQLSHWHYDTFMITGQSEETLITREGLKCTFKHNANGEVEEIAIPFDADSSDVLFKRELGEWQGSSDYLRQFTGVYEVEHFPYYYTLEIILRNNSLFVYVAGFPLYELIPGDRNEFHVKAMGGMIFFDQNTSGEVEEVRLIHPYYGKFMGKQKKVS
jgi:CubicO group peptidase (beta-lactamase class C family)